MNYEGGGTLSDNIYNVNSIKFKTLVDKVRIARLLACALAKIHALGAIHGDLKSSNIVLSDSNLPLIRFIDFGLAEFSNSHVLSLLESSLRKTLNQHDTPLYSAPEMLLNPNNCDGYVELAKASRKTDMYAFVFNLGNTK
jgi:serine/threonine protein kinase